ncbi:cupin domain-containing protein [Desulfovibrio desulfuricans]|uniref:Cupin domain-containing protein n=1 Tax=Desulfovibrio desulfuricans TaxID=876 RepID=A0A4P7UFR9_DESDE|nr:cupin domain-containing protein [Desulfovibrio desulfuricans]QCC84853.1 cupin domain-containing protein [Desulfovibrio desulfuricans]
MERILKNLDYAAALPLAAQVECQPGQIASKTLIQNASLGITLFAFDANEEISSHTSTGDAMVLVLEGSALVTINGQSQTVQAGEFIVMPAGQPHAVRAQERFKMLLTVVFPPKAAA